MVKSMNVTTNAVLPRPAGRLDLQAASRARLAGVTYYSAGGAAKVSLIRRRAGRRKRQTVYRYDACGRLTHVQEFIPAWDRGAQFTTRWVIGRRARRERFASPRGSARGLPQRKSVFGFGGHDN